MNSSIFEKTSWRLGRWLITGFVFTVVGVISPSSIRQLMYVPYALVIGGLLIPEMMRLFPQMRQRAMAASVIGDAVIIAILSLGLNHGLILLYAVLIIASSSLTAWYVPLLLSLAAIGTNIAAYLLGVTYPQQLVSIVVSSIAFFLTGAISSVIGCCLARETVLRNELKKKVENRSDRLSMLSHEIRTPLALIQASVELILDGAPGPLTDQQRTFMENVDENSRHIMTLAENMLTQSKLESGFFTPVFQLTDVRDIIRVVVANMSIFTARRGQSIQTYYPQVLPRVKVDSMLLKQALTNITQNAIHHTSAGGRIIISVAKNDLGLLISITDDGAGMSAEHRQQLFRRFAASGEGTGLGLVIVKKIMEVHDGHVYVDTSLGRGTTFFLTLPIKIQQTEDEIVPSQQTKVPFLFKEITGTDHA
ncbi:MAG: HAMP domain-containing histidine kinase [Anaerolineaceae bacterium]|nr:HAMP domain-containing histidine kinase [Anaerolineaceae bacterium]